MKLSLLTHEQHTDTAQIRVSPAQAAKINRQLQSMVPGQTVSGEIVGRNGSEVLIKLSEDVVLNARVEQNINVEIGQNMTFEVKSNGSTLLLSPLFTNVSADVNVLKALDMAGIAVNDASVEMTKQLMSAGLPVNRGMLQQLMREINAFPHAEVSDIVNLHKLNMPVNETNVGQMASYRNLTHQLSGGLKTILHALTETMNSMAAEGELAGALKVYRELFLLIQEGDGDFGQGVEQMANGAMGAPETMLSEEGLLHEVSTSETNVLLNASDTMKEVVKGNLPTDEGHQLLQEMLQKVGNQQENTGRIPAGQDVNGEQFGSKTTSPAIPEAVRNTISGDMIHLMENLQISEQNSTLARELMQQFASGNAGVDSLCAVARCLTELVNKRGDAGAMELLHKTFSGKEFRELLSEQLKKIWTISPSEVAEPGKVEELYQRLNKQIKSLSAVLEAVNRTDSMAFKAVTNMNQNLDFLNQVNHLYTYVQLPLKLQQGEAHGELYVYTNKKNLAKGEEPISALLHLDMEHLGAVDVYVSMQRERVNTQFYVQDDAMLDFLESHMDLFTARLQKRGYDCNVSLTSRQGKDSGEGGIETILRQEKGIMLSKYAFDVRA